MSFIKSLLSRKLIIAVIAVAYFISIGEYNQALVVILGYFGANVAETFKSKELDKKKN